MEKCNLKLEILGRLLSCRFVSGRILRKERKLILFYIRNIFTFATRVYALLEG